MHISGLISRSPSRSPYGWLEPSTNTDASSSWTPLLAMSNEPLADSINHLLGVGFYLINIGYVCMG